MHASRVGLKFGRMAQLVHLMTRKRNDKLACLPENMTTIEIPMLTILSQIPCEPTGRRKPLKSCPRNDYVPFCRQLQPPIPT